MKMVCVLGDLVLAVFQRHYSQGGFCLLKNMLHSQCSPLSLSFFPVIKTRLQSLQRGVNEDTYSGILDCTK